MAERVPDCDAKERLKRLKEKTENENNKKDHGYSLVNLSRQKRFQPGYCELRRQGTCSEAGQVFLKERKKDGSNYDLESLRVMLASHGAVSRRSL